MKLSVLTYLLLITSFAWAGNPPSADREAILGMAGEFEVLFNFEETVAYADGYKLKKPYQEDATEIVFVVEDTGSRIALQHILQTSGSRVVKHWKQIWTWEDRRLVEYQGNNHWKIRELSEDEAKGHWTQLVTQVDDSPRYEGIGEWRHDRGVSIWESNRTARPLPRREHTTRDDYEILMGVNRHVLTPHGWAHEQDNLKLAHERDGAEEHYIVREQGVNHYDRVDDVDFSAALEYWAATESMWNQVSSLWTEIEAN
ncbi:MAG: DUF6607 family protein [Verrucomicrobiota bacterium]